MLKEVKPLVLYAVEHRIAKEQMRGKWSSSCVDFGYTDILCIPEMTSEFISSCDSMLGTLWGSLKKIEAPYVFNWEYDIALHEMQGNQHHLPARGMCLGISRVAAGTWGIFSSYSGDGHSKLQFVQRSQDSCLVTTDTSGI